MHRSTALVDKYDDAHIFLGVDMFTDKIEPLISNWVTTIGGNDLILKGVVTFFCPCYDDEGKLHTKTKDNLLYFPYSPVSIISAALLA